MNYKIEFQYKRSTDSRPYDEVQEEEIGSDSGQYIPVPAVGDTVICNLCGKRGAFKVLTRHFTYTCKDDLSFCNINIVVTDVDAKEMAERLKE